MYLLQGQTKERAFLGNMDQQLQDNAGIVLPEPVSGKQSVGPLQYEIDLSVTDYCCNNYLYTGIGLSIWFCYTWLDALILKTVSSILTGFIKMKSSVIEY